MLVPEAEQDWPLRSPLAGTSHETLLDHACSGHAGAAADGRRTEVVVCGSCGRFRRKRQCAGDFVAWPSLAAMRARAAPRFGEMLPSD
jgi:hypothetical protein